MKMHIAPEPSPKIKSLRFEKGITHQFFKPTVSRQVIENGARPAIRNPQVNQSFSSPIIQKQQPGNRSGPETNWQGHRNRGVVVNSGTVNLPGSSRQVGHIQVRINDWERGNIGNDSNRITTTLRHEIAFSYQAGQPSNGHWLQFNWGELLLMTSQGIIHASGAVNQSATGTPASAFSVDPTRPTWRVDALQSGQTVQRPWYASNIGPEPEPTEHPFSLVMWDMPGGGVTSVAQETIRTMRLDGRLQARVLINSCTLNQHFDTYLVVEGVPLYHCIWVANRTLQNPEDNANMPRNTNNIGDPDYTEYRNGREQAVGIDPPVSYSFGQTGPLQNRRLPSELQRVLDNSYGPGWLRRR